MDPGTLNAIQGFAAISSILVGVAFSVTGLRWVWLRMGRPPAVDADTLQQLQAALGRLEENEHRVAELEERVDFSERMLAQQQPQPVERLPRG
jgi:hypothetical protein